MPQSTVNRGLQGIMPTYFDRQFGLGGPSITWRPSPLEQAQTSAAVNARIHAAAQFALGFIPGYDLVRTAMNPRADALDWTAGVLGVLPGLGKGAVMGAKGIYAAVPLLGGAVREVRAVEAVAARSGGTFVDGYRAVSRAEADDIALHGFRPNPSGRSMGDKWFSETRAGADQFRKNYPDLQDVVHTKVPKDIYDRSYKHPNVDNTGPGFCVQCADLPSLPKP